MTFYATCSAFLSLLLVGGLVIGMSAPAAETGLTSNERRADFLLNLPLAIQWPIVQHPGPHRVHLCTTGREAVSTALEQALMSRLANRFTLHPDTTPDDLPRCDILYIPSTQQEMYRKWQPQIARSTVVSVGEGEEFLRQGGMIAFTGDRPKAAADRRTVPFRINLQAANAQGIAFDPMLLELAEAVEGSAR